MSELVIANGGSIEIIGDNEELITTVTSGTPTILEIQSGLPGPQGDPGNITPEQIATVVSAWLDENPVQNGMVYNQLTPLASWTIPHGFARRPNVAIYDISGEEVVADVAATSTVVTITFASPISGQAVLS